MKCLSLALAFVLLASCTPKPPAHQYGVSDSNCYLVVDNTHRIPWSCDDLKAPTPTPSPVSTPTPLTYAARVKALAALCRAIPSNQGQPYHLSEITWYWKGDQAPYFGCDRVDNDISSVWIDIPKALQP